MTENFYYSNSGPTRLLASFWEVLPPPLNSFFVVANTAQHGYGALNAHLWPMHRRHYASAAVHHCMQRGRRRHFRLCRRCCLHPVLLQVTAVSVRRTAGGCVCLSLTRRDGEGPQQQEELSLSTQTGNKHPPNHQAFCYLDVTCVTSLYPSHIHPSIHLAIRSRAATNHYFHSRLIRR